MPDTSLLLVLLLALPGAACDRRVPAGERAVFELMAVWPHDSGAYTQGLVWADSILYESTGRYGVSQLRRVDLRSGRVLAAVNLAPSEFGEGLALLQNRLYQLTWKSQVAYVYDAVTLARLDSFPVAGEGWGLATDGTSFFLSDGSDSLRVLSPSTFAVERVVHVRYRGEPLRKLNELEYVNGELLANVYESDWILRIDPVTGDVRELLDFAELYPQGQRSRYAEVMNGIAAAEGSGRLFLTGKLWPKLFEVQLRAPAAKP
ncbi:MAG: glutaminyl-peptide cyclotransferase [Gemmatimonadaceae bacterium]